MTKQAAGVTSVAKKYIMALSGLGLIGFVVMHLLGNLLLYKSDGSFFNGYAKSLENLGKLLYAAEIGLVAMFLMHIFLALAMKKGHLDARPVGYKVWRSKGGGTPSGLASRNMIWTGLVLLAFLIFHICQFKFGASVDQGYVTQVHGEEVRDLHRLVVETFKQPLFVGIYVFCMALLGLHLRHGFWSSLQSLGITRGNASKMILMFSAALGFILSMGFLFIPVWIYFFA
jgi:succinate dehydrogenase / fumarate reductase, cytochrome b subunit